MSRLLIVRHGVAEDRESFARRGADDALRPLTKEGKIRVERVAGGLRRTVGKLTLIGTSPFVRAAQTARIIASVTGGKVVTVDALAPEGTPAAFLGWLRGLDATGDTVAAVGHEPQLGALITWLLTGIAAPHVPLRRGGACLLEFDGRPQQGGASLAWSLTPSMLRRLG